nr:reverse transcriptase domain-containing protein [Tanacetum cinerariifolium]
MDCESGNGIFKQIKKSIAELPMLTTPKEKDELIIYLAAAKEAISAVLMTERDGKQVTIYFVSRALQGPKINYIPIEKLILALEPMEDQPLPTDASPTALSLGYVVDFEDEKDPKEDPAYYPADRGDNDDD